jgi:predicted amidohydrolase
MKVVLAQMAPKLGDLDGNLARHLELIRKARRKGASLVVFPELSLTGYLLQDLVHEIAERPGGGLRMKALASASRECGVIAGFVEQAAGFNLYNSGACLLKGSLAHVHRKVYLPTYGMFDEGRYFGAGDTFRTFDAPWGPTGILVCEDFWHLSSSYLLSLQGVDLLVVISASPVKGVGRSRRPRGLAIWEEIARVVARHLTCWVIYVNRVGYEDGWAFQGGSFICSPSGELMARAGFLEEDLVIGRLDASELRKARITSPLVRDEKPDLVRREMERILAGSEM